MRYARIKVAGKLPFNLRIEHEDERFVSGLEVRDDGDPIEPRGADVRRHVIERAAITWQHPLVMDARYGELIDPAERAALAEEQARPERRLP